MEDKETVDSSLLHKLKNYWDIIFIIVPLIISVIFIRTLVQINIIPLKYIIGVAVVILLLLILIGFLMFRRYHIAERILSVVLCAVLIALNIYAGGVNQAFEKITEEKQSTDQISYIVLADDPAQSLMDAKDYEFGYSEKDDLEMVDASIQEAVSRTSTQIESKNFSNTSELINALYNQEVPVIIFNESSRYTMEENFPDFASDTRVIDTFDYVTAATQKEATVTDFSSDTFTVYISGNDDYGTLTTNGRSDVNILLTINPTTRQVLLVSTPRDYWVEVDTTKGTSGYEKLTHAGNYGIESSMATLGNLYGMDIDYYVKVNFDGAVGVVDALGGITIQSDIAFTAGENASSTPYQYVVGDNQCDGEKTLAFCRERYAFSDGDNQRGRNQMQALKGMISKATSPVILTNYSSVLSAVEEMIATNVSQDNITDLIRSQIADSTAWNVQSYSVTGTGATRTGELFGLVGMSVQIPNMDTVNNAITMMQMVRDGVTFDVADYQ